MPLQPCAQLAVRARDPFWHEILYRTLIDLGAVRELLALDGSAPGLEAYLRSHGGLTGAVPGVPIGPLSSTQARWRLGDLCCAMLSAEPPSACPVPSLTKGPCACAVEEVLVPSQLIGYSSSDLDHGLQHAALV